MEKKCCTWVNFPGLKIEKRLDSVRENGTTEKSCHKHNAFAWHSMRVGMRECTGVTLCTCCSCQLMELDRTRSSKMRIWWLIKSDNVCNELFGAFSGSSKAQSANNPMISHDTVSSQLSSNFYAVKLNGEKSLLKNTSEPSKRTRDGERAKDEN